MISGSHGQPRRAHYARAAAVASSHVIVRLRSATALKMPRAPGLLRAPVVGMIPEAAPT